MKKVTPITKNKDHEQFEAVCLACGIRFVASLPVGKLLHDMICPQCGEEDSIIRTGEHAENLEHLIEKYGHESVSSRG